MRRVKFKMEQKAVIEAKSRLFKEHEDFKDEEILIDYEGQLENMDNYL